MIERFDWTDDNVERLRNMAPTHSASKIGEALGCSRNAVIGKCHRDGVYLGKPKASAEEGAPPPPPIQRVETAHLPAVIASAEPKREIRPAPRAEHRPGAKTLAELGHMDCRWPLGDPRSEDFCYCGARRKFLAKRKELGPYCEEHHAVSVGPGTSFERAAHLPKPRRNGQWV